MKRHKILHRTHYQFTAPVELKPHYLRVRPRESHELRIESSQLRITPNAALRWYRDAEGNSVAIASFSSNTAALTIESEVIIQHYDEAPLDFLVADYARNYPFTYQDADFELLQPYLQHSNSDLLAQWRTNNYSRGENIEAFALLQRLCTAVNKQLDYRIREEPGVQSPEETLQLRTGSCRDFSNLFIHTARSLGFATRFVSGYLQTPTSDVNYGATHAWAEVFLPGAGWKGFDPTQGIVVGTGHIPVAVARLPESVPPVEGAFVGPPGSTLEVGVKVIVLT